VGGRWEALLVFIEQVRLSLPIWFEYLNHCDISTIRLIGETQLPAGAGSEQRKLFRIADPSLNEAV
jgi:hypothetical protein